MKQYEVYEPREDSWQLAEQVEKHAFGSVLDVGCGSGIQAHTAAGVDAVTTVEAVDINTEAIEQTRKHNIEAYYSDKFSHIKGVYDTIISNTPYLPNEPLAPDIALDGGEKGYEWTTDFLTQAKTYLNAHGQILFLISSLTNTHIIERTLLELGYAWDILSREKHSFEELYVYKATHALPEHPEATFIAAGKKGRVYKIGELAVKKVDEKEAATESYMLQKVNTLGIGPQHHKTYGQHVYMEYIEGERIGEWIQGKHKEEIREMFEKIKHQLRILDEHNIDKTEMTNPYKHILIREGKPILIDWERARIKQKTHNLTQFEEYEKRILRTSI